MTSWTAPRQTFNPRVLGSNPSRLTTIPRVNWALADPLGRLDRPFDSHADSHGESTWWTVCDRVDRSARGRQRLTAVLGRSSR